tara:strand:- start:173 stop:313 length:141 start_codon:yes stop_codon:yes gene_type:complete
MIGLSTIEPMTLQFGGKKRGRPTKKGKSKKSKSKGKKSKTTRRKRH